MSILSTIEAKGFKATAEEVEQLARERQEGLLFGERAGVSYLKILTALTITELPTGGFAVTHRRRKATTPEERTAQLAALEAVNSTCYGAVTKAVITPDIEKVATGLSKGEQTRRAQERNRRTNYARTAMSALRRYVEVGRDLRDLDPVQVSKAQLWDIIGKYTPEQAPQQTADRVARAADAHSKRLLADVDALVTADPVRAGVWLEQLLDTLHHKLEAVHQPEQRKAA